MKNLIQEYGMVLVVLLLGTLLLGRDADSGWLALVSNLISSMCDGSLS